MRILNRLILFGAIMLLSVASYGQNKRVRGNYAGPAYAGLAVIIDTSGYTVVDSAATPAVQVDTTFEGALLQYDTLTDTWESVNRAAVLGYKEYVALLTQTGTSAPVATVLYNDLGGTVVWTRDGVGEYVATLTGGFTLNKTVPYPKYNFTSVVDDVFIEVLLASVNVVELKVYSAGILADAFLTTYPVTFRVYN